MKKLNRTYIMGIVFIILALWVLFQTTQIPEKLVSNEPGPKLFPYISAIGMIVMAVLSMVKKKQKITKMALLLTWMQQDGNVWH